RVEIDSVATLLAALTLRLEHFMRAGCRVTDHSLEGPVAIPGRTTLEPSV
ncbi:MAG: glucuronate isomerase, partial [Selenomonadaceae bacterium]|nr:glucuronate isomerase [Selenomonadaceae bacterium]